MALSVSVVALTTYRHCGCLSYRQTHLPGIYYSVSLHVPCIKKHGSSTSNVLELTCHDNISSRQESIRRQYHCGHLASATGYSTSVRFRALAKNNPSATRCMLPPSCSLLSVACTRHGRDRWITEPYSRPVWIKETCSDRVARTRRKKKNNRLGNPGAVPGTWYLTEYGELVPGTWYPTEYGELELVRVNSDTAGS